MLRNNLLLLLWGLLFIAVDIKLDELDVFFDPLGFVMTFAALNRLGAVERSFERAAALAVISAVIKLILWHDGGDGSSFLPLADAAVYFLMLWYVITGVMQLARTQGQSELWSFAERQRKFTFIASALAAALILLAPRANRLIEVLAIPAFLFACVVLGLTLLMLLRASRQLAS